MSNGACFGHLEIHFNAEVEHIRIFHLECNFFCFFMVPNQLVAYILVCGKLEVGIFSHNFLQLEERFLFKDGGGVD